MILLLFIGFLIVIFGGGLFVAGLYYYYKSKAQHEKFLETQKDFKEYMEFKKELDNNVNSPLI